MYRLASTLETLAPDSPSRTSTGRRRYRTYSVPRCPHRTHCPRPRLFPREAPRPRPFPLSRTPRGDPYPGFRAILNLWVIFSCTFAVVPVRGGRRRRRLLHVHLWLLHDHGRRVVVRRRIPVVGIWRSPPESRSDPYPDEDSTAAVMSSIAGSGREQHHSPEEHNDQQPDQCWPSHSRPPRCNSSHIHRTTNLDSRLPLHRVGHAPSGDRLGRVPTSRVDAPRKRGTRPARVPLTQRKGDDTHDSEDDMVAHSEYRFRERRRHDAKPRSRAHSAEPGAGSALPDSTDPGALAHPGAETDATRLACRYRVCQSGPMAWGERPAASITWASLSTSTGLVRC